MRACSADTCAHPHNPCAPPFPLFCLQRQQCDAAKSSMYCLRDEVRTLRLQEDSLEQQLGAAQRQLAAASETGAVRDQELAWTSEQLEVGLPHWRGPHLAAGC